YVAVCRDLNLDDDESRRLWRDIVKEIKRVAAVLDDLENASEADIRAACDRLGVPSFRRMGEIVRGMRPLPIASTLAPGGFTRITRSHRALVEALAEHVFGP